MVEIYRKENKAIKEKEKKDKKSAMSSKRGSSKADISKKGPVVDNQDGSKAKNKVSFQADNEKALDQEAAAADPKFDNPFVGMI